MAVDPSEGEASGAEQRQAWFMNQRFRTILNKDPLKDVEDELPPTDPVDPHTLPVTTPPSLVDLMREYRLRLQDAADGG
jgi:hypothetical protein